MALTTDPRSPLPEAALLGALGDAAELAEPHPYAIDAPNASVSQRRDDIRAESANGVLSPEGRRSLQKSRPPGRGRYKAEAEVTKFAPVREPA